MPVINIHLGGDGWGEAGAAGDFDRALEELREQISMRARLPQLLSRAVLAGYREEVLDALVAWGSGSRAVRQVWQEMAALLPDAGQVDFLGREKDEAASASDSAKVAVAPGASQGIEGGSEH